jgi:hypothetical protein
MNVRFYAHALERLAERGVVINEALGNRQEVPLAK